MSSSKYQSSNKKNVGWFEEGCAQEMPSQSNRFGAYLQIRDGEDIYTNSTE